MRRYLTFEKFKEENTKRSLKTDLLEFLKVISKGKNILKASSTDFKSFVDKNLDKAYKLYDPDSHENQNMFFDFLQDYNIESGIWTQEAKTLYEIEFEEDDSNFTEEIVEQLNIQDLLTDSGKKIFENFRRLYFENLIDETGLIDALGKLNSEGLLPIYRAIIYVTGNNQYKNMLDYQGVSIYWTYNENNAEAHCGYGAGETVIYHAAIKLEDIDWPQTLMRSAWNCRDEKEIMLTKKAMIKIYGFEIDNKYQELEINYVVPVGK